MKANRPSVFTPTKRGGKTTDLQRIASWKQRLSTECVWTAVGIKPMVDVIQFDLCARDELENLEAIIKDYRIGELKRVAHSMAQKVDSLIGVTRELVLLYRFYGLPTHVSSIGELAFTKGYVALDNRCHEQAYGHFCEALKTEPYSLRNQLFCAWASFLVDESHAKERLNELEISAAARPGYFPANRFIAAIKWRIGSRKEAIAGLERMVGESDDRSAALLKKIKTKGDFPIRHIHRN